MLKDVFREITPLTQNDCFTISSRKKKEFNFPLHIHEEMELNLIIDAKGTKRIVGDHIGEIGNFELVLVGPNLPHGWFNHQCNNPEILEVTIQFQKDILNETFLRKTQLTHIKRMLESARRGLSFSEETTREIYPRIASLDKKNGFDSVLELFSILNDLSVSRDARMLSDETFTKEAHSPNSRRLEQAFQYMHSNYSKDIALADVAKIANMTEASFSRFIKSHTGQTFTDNLNDIRLGHVSRMLIDTSQSIAEIAYKCGYNNLANFNRIFRTRKGLTPKEFKQNYMGHRVFV
jgi:AraC-like DNA-binding protein